MLEFFRKYQRYFFIFVTILIIASFSFFGTFGAFSEGEKREEKVVGQAIDGSPLLLSQIQNLSRFLATDREDPWDGRQGINFLNDGVIRYDFLRTGLADLLVFEYFDVLKEDLQARMERAKRFRPYAHSTVPFLSAKAVWEKFLPAMIQELTTLQEKTEASPQVFYHLARLYQQQSYFQPEILQRILAMQHQQVLGMPLDPRLIHEDLSLFGFRSLQDWFGNRFIDLVAQFIWNASLVAEEKGYRVSSEEAKGDLLYTFQQSMEKLASAKANIQLNFHEQLRLLGFDEKSAIETWRRVLLFRKYFQDVGQAAFVDRLPYRDFAEYVQETAVIRKYQWPRSLQLENQEDLMDFQMYLKAVAPPSQDPLSLPTAFFSVDEVAKEYPELVETTYKARVIELSKQELALRASLKEVWDWELEDRNWQLLRREFPLLKNLQSREEKFQFVQNLDPAMRMKIEAYSRNALVDSHPNWVEEAFLKATPQERVIAASASSLSLSHVTDGKKLAQYMERAASGDAEAAALLLNYSDDGKTLYRIDQVEKKQGPHLLTFEEARAPLRKISERYLETKGLQKSQFLKEVLQAIAKAEGISIDSAELATYRLASIGRCALTALQNDKADPKWIQSGDNPLLDQFKLESIQQEIQRTSQEEWMKEQVFVMVPDQWSPIYVAEDGKVLFFYLEEKKVNEKPIFEQLNFGKETLAADAQRYLAERLLETAKAKKAIVLPLQEEIQ